MRWRLLLGPVILIAIWYAVSSLGLVRPLFLPSPHAVLSTLVDLVQTAPFWRDMAATATRVVVSFCAATLIGVPLGLLLGYKTTWYESGEVLVDFFRSLPALALFPLMILVFGIGDGSKIATAVFGAALIITVSGIYGVQNGRRARRTAAQLYGANRRELFLRVIAPDALPELFGGLRIGVSAVVVIIIVTEMFIGSTAGIGQRLFQAQLTYRVSELYSWILVSGLLGYALNKLVQQVERRIVHWRGE